MKINNKTNYTEMQIDFLNKMQAICDHAKELKENCNGYVVAGNDGAGVDYCYCGEGNGYEGAPIRPSSIWAVVFESRNEAESKAKGLVGYRNGAGHNIEMGVEAAWYYFESIHSQMLGCMETAKNLFDEVNNNSKK